MFFGIEFLNVCVRQKTECAASLNPNQKNVKKEEKNNDITCTYAEVMMVILKKHLDAFY